MTLRRSRRSTARPVLAMVTDAIAPYHRGGKEQRYQELAPRLQQYADVHVYTMNWWGGSPTTRLNGVTYHAICPFLPLYRANRRSVKQAVVFALACFRLLLAPMDVLEADHMPYLQLFPLKLVTLIRRKRLVVTWHEVWDLTQWRAYLGAAGIGAWALERLAMRLPDCIIAASAPTAERLSGRTRDAVSVVVAPNGVDLEMVMRTAPAPVSVDIVSVGRLISHKRFELLLNCVAYLARHGAARTCRIIGDGPERVRLHEQAQRLGILHLVEFRHDVQSAEELVSLVKASRLFVSPSEREGFGIATLEAIACGVPVITTNAPHNLARHLVARSEHGIVCEPTAAALGAAVESALSTRSRPAPVNEWLGEFDWSVMAARIAHALVDGHVEPVEATGQRPDSSGIPTPFALPAPDFLPGGLASARPTLNPLHAPTASPVAEAEVGEAGVDSGSDGGIAVTDEFPYPDQGAEPPREYVPGIEPTGRRPRPAALVDLVVSLLALAAMVALAHVRGIWVLQAVEFFLLMLLPGTLLLRAARASPAAVSRFPIYIPCASLAVLMCSGLGIDLLGPPLGLPRPLATTPLIDTLGGVCLVLVAVSLAGNAPRLHGYFQGIPRVRETWPLALPVLAWIGAMRLNNGHGSAVAIVAAASTGLVLLIGAWRAHRWRITQSAMVLYAAALALIWGFSLRGHFVYGFDIASEYQTFTGVLHAGRWYASHHNDPYGAMLSLTILPSTFVKLAGASPLLVFKAAYPFLLALFPVAVFLLAVRVLNRRFAYLAVLFIVVQNYLFQQMPAIARQEIALLFFVCLIFALLDTRLRAPQRMFVIGLFGVGLVFSHYATAYLAIGMLLSATVIELVRARVMPRLPRFPLAPLAVALAFTAAPAAIWYSAVTHSGQNFSSFVSDVTHHGLAILPNASGNLLRSYVSGNAVTQVSASRYETLAHQEYANRHYIRPLPQAHSPAFRLRRARVPGKPIVSHPAVNALNTGQIVVSQLAILLSIVGAFCMWLRRDVGNTGRALGVLGISTLSALAAIRLSGTIGDHYNQERAYLQAMVPLSICLAFILQWLTGWERLGRVGRAALALFVIGLGVLFVNNSGLEGAALGPGSATNLASKGEDFDRYYFTPPELAAAAWLNASAAPGDIISADRYGTLRMAGATGRVDAVFPDVTPLTLDRAAWIYADSANFLGRRAEGEVGSRLSVYAWPTRFVDDYWNLVYSSGSSAVYARSH